VLESGDPKLARSEIPATLHDSLMARRDRLGAACRIPKSNPRAREARIEPRQKWLAGVSVVLSTDAIQ